MAEPEKFWIKLREEFVQNLNGTSKEEILLLTPLPALFLFISISIKCWILTKLHFYLTVFTEKNIIILVLTLLLTLSIIIFAVSSINQKILYWRIPHHKKGFLSLNITSEKQICVTYFRTFIFIMTSISILAVDFHVFPRRFAKTENYGVSLMDLGVGLYIMASAIVTKDSSTDKKITNNFYKSLPLLSFGVLRCILMQHIDYQKHTSEYGIHWNFFITIGLVKPIANIILKVFSGHSLTSGVVLLLLHEYLLSTSLEQYVISDHPRDNLITANIEGIVSLPGYVSLYLIGISVKLLIGNTDKKNKQSIKLKLKSMTCFIILFTILLFTVKWLEPITKVSRRLANLPYVLWTVTVCFEYLLYGILFEVVSILFLPINVNRNSDMYNLLMPDLCKSINDNAFLFFLVSNLLTGFINMYFDVFSFETWRSVPVLLFYMFLNCTFVYILHLCNVKIKF